MNLFPITTPTFALSISEDALYLVEVTKSWRKIILRELQQVSLPPGVLRLSSAKPNIDEPELFLEHLNMLVKPLKRPISIALSLPDLCARTSVFDFSTFPKKVSEQTALVNWRFQQDLKLDTAQSRLAYDVYVPASLANTPNPEHPDAVRVLGTAIRNEIIEQYERSCLEAKLLPVSVSIASLDIVDLYQRTIQDILEVEDRRSTQPPFATMFCFISHWGFTFFAFKDHCPVFVRTKAIIIRPDPNRQQPDSPTGKQEDLEPIDETTGSANDTEERANLDTSPSNPYPPFTTAKVEKEILATLQYYLETDSLITSENSSANLFVVSDLEHGHMLLPSTEQIQETAKVSGLHDSLIHVTHLSYTTHLAHRSRLNPDSTKLWSALPGYASLRVA